MKCPARPYRHPLRPLAAALVSLFALTPHQTIAATVTSCDDSGAGTLRQAVMDAASGYVIDFGQLSCTISLTTGEIVAAQDSLTISGPGSDKLTIDGVGNPTSPYSMLFHSGTGAFEIDHLTLKRGYVSAVFPDKYQGGGCVSSNGELTLSYATVTSCQVLAENDAASLGGGAFSRGGMTVSHSVITANRAYGLYANYMIQYSAAQGGGLFAAGALTVDHSTISLNNSDVDGGAIFAPKGAAISYSTIAGNSAYQSTIASMGGLSVDHSTISGNFAYFAGIYAITPKHSQPQPVTISASTFSGNFAGNYLYVDRKSASAVMARVPITISNSTFARNHGPGAAVYLEGTSAQLDSSIIADNTVDLRAYASTVVSGANNLVVTTNATLSPGVVAVTACPQLEALRDNGGPTQTHALRHTSPAIDSGANPTGASYDQRGTGFQRAYGTRTDIGAFEWLGGPDETIFSAGFEPPGTFCDR